MQATLMARIEKEALDVLVPNGINVRHALCSFFIWRRKNHQLIGGQHPLICRFLFASFWFSDFASNHPQYQWNFWWDYHGPWNSMDTIWNISLSPLLSHGIATGGLTSRPKTADRFKTPWQHRCRACPGAQEIEVGIHPPPKKKVTTPGGDGSDG